MVKLAWKRWSIDFLLAIIIFSVAGILLLLAYQGARLNGLLQETKHQGEVNQRYIRCIVLIPRDTFANASTTQKAKIIDQCARDSQLPTPHSSSSKPQSSASTSTTTLIATPVSPSPLPTTSPAIAPQPSVEPSTPPVTPIQPTPTIVVAPVPTLCIKLIGVCL